MPKYVALLQDEIARLARKEVIKSQKALKKTAALMRQENAELRKRVKSLEQSVQTLQTAIGTAKKTEALPYDDEAKNSRFSPKMITRMRKKHGLSIKKMAELLGVNNNSIINWEKGDFRPRPELLKKLIAFRNLTKREVKTLLKDLPSNKTETVPVIETKKATADKKSLRKQQKVNISPKSPQF